MNTIGNKKLELFDNGAGASEQMGEENVQMASAKSNQELINAVHQTVEVGTQPASSLKAQTDQMGRIVNDLDSIQFSIKKASQLVKEIGRQVATDKCITNTNTPVAATLCRGRKITWLNRIHGAVREKNAGPKSNTRWVLCEELGKKR